MRGHTYDKFEIFLKYGNIKDTPNIYVDDSTKTIILVSKTFNRSRFSQWSMNFYLKIRDMNDKMGYYY